MDKGQIVFAWGFALLLAREFTSGDIQELIALIDGTQSNVNNPGLFIRIVGQLILVILLALVSDASDGGADLSLWFLGALTLLFFVTNTATLQSWLTQIGL